MYRKLDIKTLGWAFIGLLILTVSIKALDGAKGINTLKTELFAIDENAVTSVILKPKVLMGQSLELKRNNSNWKVLVGDKAYNGDAATITGLIRQLNELKPIRLASQSKESWERFELSDSLATEVQFLGDDGLLAQLYIGKFSYTQPKMNGMLPQQPYRRPQGTMTSYVRCADEDEVYAVEGFLGSTANRNADAFRDKTILNLASRAINKIEFSYPADSSFTIVNSEGVWMSDGRQLDSVAVSSYLSGLKSLRGSAFAAASPAAMTHEAQLFLDSGESITLSAAVEKDEVVLTSSQNQGTVFQEEKNKNFRKVFIGRKELFSNSFE
ncbi:DUF4340 domain-containing protein [Carboxylicivirga taeanensis]|uniref:DUF4340 domain-containing protein n=1 Tax=Carboxylicivirga taeanensis TaxID=1416875 RepID=UPI003F6E254C